MRIKVVKSSGKNGQVDIPDRLLKAKLNQYLVSQVYRAEILNAKQPNQTKTRAERQGGGAKPWRQKGTGRARHGSIRSPIWRKGGVTFGPRKEQNFKKRINRKMKQKAINGLLSFFYQEKRLIVVGELPKKKKTKEWQKFLSKLPIKEPGKILLVLDRKEIDLGRYGQNIPFLTIVDRTGLNISNLLNHDFLIVTKRAIKTL